MWYVCYDVNGKTHFNAFNSKEEARKCYEEDREYYLQEWGQGNFKISLAEVKIKFE